MAIVYLADSIKVAYGHEELGIGDWEAIFGGQSSKSLHCFICPNVQCPIANDQLPKQPFLIEPYTRVNYRKLYMRLHCFFPSFFSIL